MNGMKRPNITKAVLAATFALAGTLACGAENPGAGEETGGEPVGHSDASITGGSLITNFSSGPWPSVVKLSGVPGSCSGLKLNANWYLTAWHCGFAAGQSMTVTNSAAGSGGTTHTISEAVVHPTSLNFSTGKIGYDLALIRLDGTNGIPEYFATGAALVDWSSSATFTGYGCDAVAGSTNGGKKQFANVSTTSNPAPEFSIYTFYATGSNPAICSGDSGGPVFRPAEDGSWTLIGVNSAGGANSIFARTYPTMNWILEVAGDRGGQNRFNDQMPGSFVSWSSNWCVQHAAVNAASTQEWCAGITRSKQLFTPLDAGSSSYYFQDMSGNCLSIKDASNAEGAAIAVRACDGSDSVKWEILGSGDIRQFRNKQSGKCMEADWFGVGTTIRQRTCQNTAQYYWVFSL